MTSGLAVSSWIEVSDDCPMDVAIHGSGMATIELGTQHENFELAFKSEALRRLIELATAALRDMDTRFTHEQAEEQNSGRHALIETTGDGGCEQS